MGHDFIRWLFSITSTDALRARAKKQLNECPAKHGGTDSLKQAMLVVLDDYLRGYIERKAEAIFCIEELAGYILGSE